MATVLITVPQTLDYLGQERYGVWVTISSLVTFMSFSDLGLGFGLMNAIADARGRDDDALARRHIAAALTALSAMAVLLAATFLTAYPLTDWAALLNAGSTAARDEVGPALMALAACIVLSLPIGTVQRIQMGYQVGYIANLWQCAGGLVALAAVLTCVWLKAAIVWLVLAMLAPPLATSAINGLLWFHRHPQLLPGRGTEVSLDAVRKLMKLGLLFLTLQICASVAFASDNLIIAHVLGPEKVAGYAVTAQMFNAVSLTLGMALFPLWPAYGEALARSDFEWIKSALRKSVVYGALVSLVGAGTLALFGNSILALWTDGRISVSNWLLFSFAIWKVLEGIGNATAMFLNGLQIVKLQVVLATSMCTIAVLAKTNLAIVLGMEGVIWGTILPYLAVSLVPLAWFLPRIISGLAVRTDHATASHHPLI